MSRREDDGIEALGEVVSNHSPERSAEILAELQAAYREEMEA